MTPRRQFTSCDACRKSRVRCDAVNRDDSCTNCIRRKKSCSFQWIEQFAGGRRRRHVDRTSQNRDRDPSLVSTGTEVLNDNQDSQLESILNRRQQALTLHHVLWDIFTSLYEPQLGLWIGTECNPFKNISTAPKTLITRLMILLDNSSSSSIDPSTHRQLGLFDIEISEQDRSEQEHIINQALISAVHAFSARWMPLSCFGQATAANLPKLVTIKEQFIDSIWKRARKDVTQVCTRPSYRSILALYLFGVTPTSSKNKDRPIADYCMETSLRHFVQLRARKRVNETQTPLNSTSNIEPVLEVSMEAAQDEHRHLEDTAYWFGVVIDGSRALTRCQPSVLLPGLADQSQVWTLIEQQSDRFGTVFQRIQATKALLTDETVTSMVQCGFSCKTLFWKAVSRLQECLFHQTLDLPFESVLENIQKEIHRFESIFTPFLDQCARDYVLLSEKSRISFLILSFHFHLGVLIMVDTLDWQKSIAENSSTIDIARSRLSSVRAIVNLINLMLSQADPFSGDDTTSIILKDPYPEHTRNGLSRAAYSVLILYDAGTLPKQMAEVMSSSLFAGLEVLRQISFTAAESLTDLYQAYSKSDLIIRRRQPEASTFLTAVPSAFGPALTPDLFEEETFKQLDLASGDPLLVNKTIGRHEIHEVADDFAWFDLDGADFDFMTQDWSFEDCFSHG